MNRSREQSIVDWAVNLPIVAYFLLCLSIAYLLYFIRPVFFGSVHGMQFLRYIPAVDPIGVDLKQLLSYSASWAVGGQTPYVGSNLYPPLASILASPLLYVDTFTAYKIVTFLTLLSFALSAFLVSRCIAKGASNSTLLLLLFVSGALSYGFQFELERGQFNVIAFTLCLAAVYLYHHHHKYRFVAYALFSIAVQLKVYPAIFILMFVGDWWDWKGNVARMLAIAIINFAALFILGAKAFTDFVGAIRAQALDPFAWVGNHSIASFVSPPTTWQIGTLRLDDYTRLMEVVLFAIVGVCLLLMVIKAYRQRVKGLNGHLFLACTLAGLLIPSVSHDYTLSLLPGAIALALMNRPRNNDSTGKRLFSVALLIVISFTYAVTLFPYVNKPGVFENNCPVLLAMLLTITLLNLMDQTSTTSRMADDPVGQS